MVIKYEFYSKLYIISMHIFYGLSCWDMAWFFLMFSYKYNFGSFLLRLRECIQNLKKSQLHIWKEIKLQSGIASNQIIFCHPQELYIKHENILASFSLSLITSYIHSGHSYQCTCINQLGLKKWLIFKSSDNFCLPWWALESCY